MVVVVVVVVVAVALAVAVVATRENNGESLGQPQLTRKGKPRLSAGLRQPHHQKLSRRTRWTLFH